MRSEVLGGFNMLASWGFLRGFSGRLPCGYNRRVDVPDGGMGGDVFGLTSDRILSLLLREALVSHREDEPAALFFELIDPIQGLPCRAVAESVRESRLCRPVHGFTVTASRRLRFLGL
jgi:hypothetical protein